MAERATTQVSSAASGGADDVAVPAGYENVSVRAVPLTKRRKAIARNLAATASEVPHLTADALVDCTRLLDAKASWDAQFDLGEGPKVSLLAMIAHATAKLLPKHPALNATHSDRHQLLWEEVNLGLAVDAPDGLLVPVIKRADELALDELAATIGDLARRARAGKLKAAELFGGTFTISNPGSVGPTLRAEAILTAPQVALLGITALRCTPMAVEGAEGPELALRHCLTLSVTFDHRAIDGADVIRFLNDLTAALQEEPSRTLGKVT